MGILTGLWQRPTKSAQSPPPQNIKTTEHKKAMGDRQEDLVSLFSHPTSHLRHSSVTTKAAAAAAGTWKATAPSSHPGLGPTLTPGMPLGSTREGCQTLKNTVAHFGK